MKLNPTTQPTGKPTVNRMWVVTISGQDYNFCDADIAHRFYSYNLRFFPHIEEVNCEQS